MIFIFIDGFGIGEQNPDKNPICAALTPNLDRLVERWSMYSVDAGLGIEGLPQSATGQTAIFTGVNASAILGRHMSGQPTDTLRKLIHKDNLFKRLVNMGFSVTNANVYRNEYLIKMLDPADKRHKPSVTSVMTMSAGVDFRTTDDFENGLGVYHDITGQILIDSGYDVKRISPEEAAERLYNISREYDFTLFEHFMTDIVGHTGDMSVGITLIEQLDTFLGALVSRIDFDRDVLVIASDHGNIEDISVKTHTHNRVPLIIAGKAAKKLNKELNSLTDIFPVIIEIFSKRENL